MPQGFQTFDENGLLVIDVTDKLTRFIGSFQTTQDNGSRTLTGLTGGESWIFIHAHSIVYPTGETGTGILFPNIVKNGNVVSWIFDVEQPQGEKEIATILYGEM